VEEKVDGEQLPEMSRPTLYNGHLSRWDYSECKSKTGICGVCGATVPQTAKCSADTDCGPDACCRGSELRTVTVDCQGTCVQRSADACPSFFSWEGVKGTLVDSANYVAKVGECVARQATPQIPSAGDLSCSLDGSSWTDAVLKVLCEQLKPQLRI